jgi:hypothetical protein
MVHWEESHYISLQSRVYVAVVIPGFESAFGETASPCTTYMITSPFGPLLDIRSIRYGVRASSGGSLLLMATL